MTLPLWGSSEWYENIVIREGSWWLRSESDTRWDHQGRGRVGGLVVPEEVSQKIEELTQIYGDPPDDLTWGYMKD